MNKEEVSAFDDFGHRTLDAISKANQFNKWMYECILPFVKGDILELGSGIGNITDFILRDFSSVTISDYNPDYTEFLKKKYAQQRKIKEILSIDLQSANFKKEYKSYEKSFDTIILLNVIEHLQDDSTAIEYCNFLLKSGGNLILLAPAYSFLFSKIDKNLGHFRRYTKESLSKLIIQKDFSLTKVTYFNFLGAIGWLLFNKILMLNNINSTEMRFFNRLVPLAKRMDKMICNQIGLSTILIGNKK